MEAPEGRASVTFLIFSGVSGRPLFLKRTFILCYFCGGLSEKKKHFYTKNCLVVPVLHAGYESDRQTDRTELLSRLVFHNMTFP